MFLNNEKAKETFNDFLGIDRFLFIFPHQRCLSFAGIGYHPGDTSWINHQPREDRNYRSFYRTLLHEFGHNSALGHDNLKNMLSYMGLSGELSSNYMVASKWMWGWISDNQIVNIGTPRNSIKGGCVDCMDKFNGWIYSSDQNIYLPNKKYGVRVYLPNENAQIWIEHRSSKKQPKYEGGVMIYWYSMVRNFAGKPKLSRSSEYITIEGKKFLSKGEVFNYKIGDKYLILNNLDYDPIQDRVRLYAGLANYTHRKFTNRVIECNSTIDTNGRKAFIIKMGQYSVNEIRVADCTENFEAYIYRSLPRNRNKKNFFNNYDLKIDQCYENIKWVNSPQLSEHNERVLDWTNNSFIIVKNGSGVIELKCREIIECPKNSYLQDNKCVRCPKGMFTADTKDISLSDCYEKCDSVIYDNSVYSLVDYLIYKNNVVFENKNGQFIRKRDINWEMVSNYTQINYDKIFWTKKITDRPNSIDGIECSCSSEGKDDSRWVKLNGVCHECPNRFINSWNDGTTVQEKCHMKCEKFEVLDYGIFSGIYEKFHESGVYINKKPFKYNKPLYMKWKSRGLWVINDALDANYYYAQSSMSTYFKHPLQMESWYQGSEKYPVMKCLDPVIVDDLFTTE